MTDDDVLTLFLLGYSSSLYSPFGECQRESDVLPFLSYCFSLSAIGWTSQSFHDWYFLLLSDIPLTASIH